MKSFTPYLNFDGRTRDAMTFYHECLGGKLDVQTFGDSQMPGPPGSENRVIHARLEVDSGFIMASDSQAGQSVTFGNNAYVCVDCSSVEEIERFFAGISAGGTVTMPLQDTFWGARFGMCTDKFGVHWMFNCDKKG